MVCARTVLAGAGGLGPDQYLAINLSPRTLEADAFHPVELVALAKRFSIPPTQLVVEVTERESIEDLRRLQDAVASLRRHDIRVAIDDVGAGNAGLRLLSDLDFDIMKIDLSLVRAGAQHGPSEAVLKALGAMARQRGCSTVAEGIETLEQLEAVLSLRHRGRAGLLPGPSGERAGDGAGRPARPHRSEPSSVGSTRTARASSSWRTDPRAAGPSPARRGPRAARRAPHRTRRRWPSTRPPASSTAPALAAASSVAAGVGELQRPDVGAAGLERVGRPDQVLRPRPPRRPPRRAATWARPSSR